MKDETKWFIDRRILECLSTIERIEEQPMMSRSTADMDKLRASKTELNAYARILRIEYEGQIPFGFEKKES